MRVSSDGVGVALAGAVADQLGLDADAVAPRNIWMTESKKRSMQASPSRLLERYS